MVDKSVTFNNAGVLLMKLGHYPVAIDLFRGALESQVASVSSGGGVRSSNPMPPPEQESQRAEQSVSTVDLEPGGDCFSRAEYHVSNLHTYLNEGTTRTTSLLESQTTEYHQGIIDPSTSHESSLPSIMIPVSCRGYIPYLYTTPFFLPEFNSSGVSPLDAGSSVAFSTQVACCMIVFNLGLIHHTLGRHTHSPTHFYDIVNTILSSCTDCDDDENDDESSSISTQLMQLRLAIYNNYSVWCYENGDAENMLIFLEYLDDILNDESSPVSISHVIDPIVIGGIQSNIQSILRPEHGNSAAA
jgi:hypothetical protein